MKTTNIFKPITLLFILQASTLQSIELPWHQYLFNNGGGITYCNNCSNINIIQNIRCAALTAYHRITNKKADLNKILASIKTELTDIEEWILELEQEALRAIKEKYQISEDIWQKYTADLHRMKTIYTKKLQQNNPNVIHNPNVAKDILEMLITLLEKNGINPQSIHIQMITDQKEIDENYHVLARARTWIETLISPENNIFTYQHIPSSIEIFPQTNKLSTGDKMATCAHEIQHIIQHHVLTTTILMQYLTYYYNINSAEFKKQQNITNLHKFMKRKQKYYLP